jgi:hypothetical protein
LSPTSTHRTRSKLPAAFEAVRFTMTMRAPGAYTSK